MMSEGLQRLEFHRILEAVARYACTAYGKKLLMELVPGSLREKADALRLETLHAAVFLDNSVEPCFSSVETAFSAVESLKDGSIALEPVQLRGAGQFIADMGDFAGKAENTPDCATGALNGYISRLPDLKALSDKLLHITTPDGELSPSASPELRRITRRMEALRSSLGTRLSAICAGFAGTGVLRDAPPTMRAGRFVIPVASSRKNSIRGIVHDRSDSGSTFYIEPAELVEAGNELQEAVLDLEQEKRRILREATFLVREELNSIERGTEAAVCLDMIYARARYHLEWNTAFPEEGPMNLKDLVHPLLPVETAVRSDVKLSHDWRVLVVSGPNAGGKSVFLKAVALASVSSRAGLGAHVKASSTMPFFSRIFVSMGDNQSIAMHLSTYSARLSEQKNILEEGGDETLAVIDEPAAGTDPSTGTALAAVFLETVADAGVRAVVSTHMGQLKLLAREKPGFINGSMSFNPETLTPGYRFMPNLPGASCTLEAAAIAGFPEALLNRASELAGDSFSLDSLVTSLRELEEERNRELQELKNQRERFAVEKSKLLTSLEAACARTEETRLQGELERSEALRRIQSRADSLLATMAGTGDSTQRLEARRKLSDIAEREALSHSLEDRNEAVKTPAELTEGDRVSVKGWPDTGTVEKVGRTSVMVRLGSMLLKKELTELTIADTPAERTVAVSEYTTPNENPEAMLLGLTIDEAVAELDIKLDNCTASGLKRLRVIHGKGRLMKGVTDWLRRDRRVSTVSMAAPEEGGAGASIVVVRE